MKLHDSKKRLFIFLLLVSLLGLGVIFFFAWLLISQQSVILNRIFLIVGLTFVTLLAAFFGGAILLLVYSLWRSKDLKANGLVKKTVNILYPISLTIGKWFGFSSEKIKNSFIQVSNQLVKIQKKKIRPENILILAPHCLQRAKCPHKITVNTNNCKCCGLCPIGDLLTLSRKYGVEFVVATGGTFARKFVAEKTPKGIVAIACERDLASGILDVSSVPVIGVINERPEGPCYNTRVNISEVEKAILYFIQGGDS